MEWISYKDKMPPIGKRILHHETGARFINVTTVMLMFIDEQHRSHGHMGLTEPMLQLMNGHWLEIPEPPL